MVARARKFRRDDLARFVDEPVRVARFARIPEAQTFPVVRLGGAQVCYCHSRHSNQGGEREKQRARHVET